MAYNPNNPNGQATMANSAPVVVASDQSAIPVSQSTATNLKTQAESYQGGTAVGSGNPLQVTLANTGANATAVKVDGSAVTQPVSAASLPLPTGAATAAKQPALGTAGTASADVITVQGIASMTALKVDGSAVTQPVSGTVTANAGTNLNTSALALESGGNLATIKTNTDNLALSQASTTSGQKGNLILGAVTTSAPTYTTAQSNPLSLTTAGALRTDSSATTQPVSGTVSITANSAVNVAQVGGTAVDTNSGNKSAGTMRVVLATDQPSLTNALSVSNSGTFAVQAAGDIAHDAVDSGNPVKIGAKAIAHGTNPTAVAAGDRTDLYANRAGIPFSIGGHPNIVTIRANYTSAQTDQAIVTVSAGSKIIVTQIQAVCDAANTADVAVRVGFGGTTTPTTTGVVLTHPGIKSGSGSGISRGDGSGILGIGADGEDLRITSEDPTSGSLDIMVSYYTIES